MFAAVIHDHGSQPRNYGEVDGATHEAEGVNPLTGDRVRVQFRVEEESGAILEAGFTGGGSSLMLASASIMTVKLQSMTRAEAEEIVRGTVRWIEGEDPGELPEDEWSVFLEIRRFPHRASCAALAWKTACRALYG